MKIMRAKISPLGFEDRRSSVRRKVELLVSVEDHAGQGWAFVRNLSEDGMMIATDELLLEGETIVVDLPGAERTEARIVWRQDTAYGCKFKEPVSTAVVSAILLRAPCGRLFDRPDDPEFEELPIAVRPTVSEMAEWNAQFERSRGADGYRVVAYRQTSGGLMIAIVAQASGL